MAASAPGRTPASAASAASSAASGAAAASAIRLYLPARLIRVMGVGSTVALVAGGIYAADLWHAQRKIHAVIRSTRTFMTAGLVALDYKWSLMGLERGTAEYTEAREGVHARSAERVLGLCQANRGFYIKIGQAVATMQMGLPRQYTSRLAVLQSAAPFYGSSNVLATFAEEFDGRRPDELFAHFESAPFAAASLAQVHRALTFDGQKVAVKIQHPNLHELVEVDLWTLSTISLILPSFFEDLELGWMVDEIRLNITKELDFTLEGQSADRIRGSFERYGLTGVKVPRIVWPLSRRRVLTMEYMEGCKISDTAGLDAQNTDRAALSALLLETFSVMIFCFGFIHCDPHPGNLLVRHSPEDSSLELVLLDHGLYRELPDDFRFGYCKLWKALISFDTPLLHEACASLGVSQYESLFPLLLTYRPWNSSRPGGGPGEISADEMRKIREDLRNTTVAEAFAFLEALPRDMLLVFRTQDLMRASNRALGGTAASRFQVFARHALKGFHLFRHGEYAPSLSDRLAYFYAVARLKVLSGAAAVLLGLMTAARAVAWVVWGGAVVAEGAEGGETIEMRKAIEKFGREHG